MEVKWKRPDVLPSETIKVKTNEGTLYLTFVYEDKKLVEIRGSIGKAGSFSNRGIDNDCKFISIILQSQMSRDKIIKKFNKQFAEMPSGIDPFEFEGRKYTCCTDLIVKYVITVLEGQV